METEAKPITVSGEVEILNGKMRRNTYCIPYGSLTGAVCAGQGLRPREPVRLPAVAILLLLLLCIKRIYYTV